MTLVMPTRILVVGGGGREHALAWKLGREPGVNEVLVAPGSAGISTEPHVRVTGVDPLDPGAVVAIARVHASELVVIGPEAPLAAGVADALRGAGIAVFGPDRGAARLETSKAFCHEVATAAGVRTARARAFAGGQAAEAQAFVRELPCQRVLTAAAAKHEHPGRHDQGHRDDRTGQAGFTGRWRIGRHARSMVWVRSGPTDTNTIGTPACSSSAVT